MYIFKLKNEFKTKIYWNNPKYKLVNFENILKCFERYDTNFYNLNWTSQRHFWLNLQNPDNVITTNKYFLIAPVADLSELVKNPKVDWKIVYVNNFNYLNQQKTLLRVNFEVDNFFDLLKHNKDKLEISGLLSRTTLPKYTYAKIIENNKEKWVVSPNIILNEEMSVSPFVLTKISELFRYNKESLKDLYFYNTTNNIVLKKKNEGDIKNNIIRKPLFISNDYKEGWNEENFPNINDSYFSINNNLKNYADLEQKTKSALEQKFRNEVFFILIPIFYKKGAKNFYLDFETPYSILYPNTFVYRPLENINKNKGEIRDIEGNIVLHGHTTPIKSVFDSLIPNSNFLAKTSRYIAISFENIWLGYEDNIVDFATYKTVGSILKSNVNFKWGSEYLELEEGSVTPQILDDLYFDHPEKKVKGGFLNATHNEINSLFKRRFLSIFSDANLDLQNLFNEFLPDWRAKLDEGLDSFFAYLKGNIQKQTINFKDYIKVSKNNVSRDWKEYVSTLQTKYKFEFSPPLNYNLDPKLLFNKQFTNYIIISPNTRQEVDLDLFFNTPKTIEINNPNLFSFHYSENEFYDSGYSLLSYPFYNKNFVNKYLKNDTILSNSHIEHLKTNVNSINFQKQQESIQLARAYQDRSLSWFNSGLNLLSLGLVNGNSISANILAQSAFQNSTSILNNTISANRGIEDSKRAIAKFYATQNDQYLQNKIDQNILGIESLLELKEEAASIYKQTLAENELLKAHHFLNKWGWKVNEYITEVPFNNSSFITNTNSKFDYIEMEDIDFLPYLTNDENIYLHDMLKLGVWLIYTPNFEPKTFFEPRPPFLIT